MVPKGSGAALSPQQQQLLHRSVLCRSHATATAIAAAVVLVVADAAPRRRGPRLRTREHGGKGTRGLGLRHRLLDGRPRGTRRNEPVIGGTRHRQHAKGTTGSGGGVKQWRRQLLHLC